MKIEQKLNAFYDAFNAKNWEVVADLLSEDFNYFTDNCATLTKTTFLEFMKKDDWQGSGFSLKNLHIVTTPNSDLALAHYTTAFEGESKNQKYKFIAIESVVFRKENNDWKIIHFHTSNKF